MKRLLLAITALCLLAAPCYAGPPVTMMMMDKSWGGGNSQVVYSGTISGLRISSVDGTAFLDNCAALVPYADGSHLVEIYDASGRMLRGYLSAVGEGEAGGTLGDEVITAADDRTLASDTGWWSRSIGITIADGVCKFADAVSSRGVYRSENLLVLGALYRGAFDILNYSSGSVAFFIYTTPAQNSTPRSANGSYTSEYFTESPNAEYRYPYIAQRGATTTLHIDNISIKPVLIPSTSGATIVSAAGGATANFAYKNASFTYNAADYQVVVRKMR